MNASPTGLTETGLDGPLSEALVGTRRFFTKATVSEDKRSMEAKGGRAGDAFYRDRWSHDKVVRSTHGVNCTGSCSWKVYVKDGIITWEAQQTDYPSPGADRPDYEPRGCPRGAAFCWYTYSPTRVRYPYVRGVLLEMFRDRQGRPRRRPGARLGIDRGGPREVLALQEGPRKGRPGPRHVGGGLRDRGGGPRLHGQAVRPRPHRRFLPHPGHVPRLLHVRSALPRAHRRPDALLLRLVRRPAQRLSTDVRRPDRRAGVGRLVGRGLPHHVGLERPCDPHPRRPLDDGGPLPRTEGPGGGARLRRERQVRRRVGDHARQAPTAPWRWPWATSSSRSSSSTSRSRSSPTTTSGSPTCRTSSASIPGTTAATDRASTSSAGDIDAAGPKADSENAMLEAGRARRQHGRARRPQRLHRGPLRGRGTRQVEPRARRHRPCPRLHGTP